MIRSETIILRTHCGCSRTIQVDDVSESVRLPLQPTHASSRQFFEMAEPKFRTLAPISRLFVFDGEREVNGCRVFYESGEVLTYKPGLAVANTTGEWAGQVAQFREGLGGDLPSADAEFLRLHAGQISDMGARSPVLYSRERFHHVLVGVFYKAPGWSHAEDAVELFTEINKLRLAGAGRSGR